MIQSDRIYLEQLCEDDFEFYKKVYSDPDLMKYVKGALDLLSLKKSFDISLLKMSNLNENLLTVFVIKNKHNHLKIGLTSLNWNQSNNNDAEIGTIILTKYQRMNYAEEAMYLLMSYGFNSLNVKSIYGYCNPDNGVNLLTKKMGFKKLGICKYNNINSVKWKITLDELLTYKIK